MISFSLILVWANNTHQKTNKHKQTNKNQGLQKQECANSVIVSYFPGIIKTKSPQQNVHIITSRLKKKNLGHTNTNDINLTMQDISRLAKSMSLMVWLIAKLYCQFMNMWLSVQCS